MPPDVVLPGGAFIPGDALGPCGQCSEARFEVVHRWLQVKDPQDKPAELELISAQCPRCCYVDRDGRNQHGRRERRVLLGWLDNVTGEITLEPAK